MVYKIIRSAAGGLGCDIAGECVGAWRYCCRCVRSVFAGGGWAVWLVLSGVAGAENGRQKSVIVGVRVGCRAVDGDIVAGGGLVMNCRRMYRRVVILLPVCAECFCQVAGGAGVVVLKADE